MIISIVGNIGSGKDTVSDILIKNYDFKKVAFADSVKDVLSSVFLWDRKMLQGDTVESRIFRETVDQWWANKLGIPQFTPRMAMQLIGTELFRNNFNDSIWIASLEKKISSLGNNIIVSDVRFQNEFDTVKSMSDSKSIRVVRGSSPPWWEYAHDLTTQNISILENQYNIHSSEYTSLSFNCDRTLNNNGTIADLEQSVHQLVKEFR